MQCFRYITICFLIGFIFSGQKGPKIVPKKKISKSSNSKIRFSNIEDAEPYLDMFRETFLRLRETYVDSLNESEVIRSGIKGLFKPLDRYTQLLSKDKKDNLDVLRKGKYGGVGIRMGLIKDTLTVLSIFESSPAYSEGLIPGDQILKVDSISTNKMRIRDISKLIKGELGTVVNLYIRRPSTKNSQIFPLERSNIIVKNIYSFELDTNGVGYIKINKFSRNISRDLRTSLNNYKQNKSFRGLIIDVRNNSGGLLSEVLQILNDLTLKGDTLLETRGKKSNYKISSRRPVIGLEHPIIVLQNKKSASASEILAGVLQDLDRAVIIGERSFGKGLVQHPYDLNDTTSIKITTAKFYTPSGRLIQKEDYMGNGFLTDGLNKKDSLFYTVNSKRVVRGGGGINPDFKMVSMPVPSYVMSLWKKRVFTSFAANNLAYYSKTKLIDKRLLKLFKKHLDTFELGYNIPGEEYYKRVDNEMLKYFDKNKNEFNSIGKIGFKIKRFIYRNLLKNFFKKEKNKQFWFENNLKWIKNGLDKEFSYQISLNEKDRIHQSLKVDNVYLYALDFILDSNKYFDVLEGRSDVGFQDK